MYDPFELVDQWGPEKVVLVSDRRSGMRGVLVIDNTARGLGKGGTRMSPSLTVGEVARLARTMTWKWAAVDLFHGGAKAGILGDPRAAGKERILRAFARALSNEVPGVCVRPGHGARRGGCGDLRRRAERPGRLHRAAARARRPAVRPAGCDRVRGRGGRRRGRASSISTCAARVAIQGFGAVGRAAAQRLSELGAVVVGVSTAAGWAYDADGLDLAELAAAATDLGDHCVTVHPSFSPAAQDLLTAPVDVLIPAAREDTVGVEVARSTTARLVVEGANLPTTEPARQILHQRGVVVVPDFIANAGGIVAAAHSTDARYSPFVVEPTRIFPMIGELLRANTARVLRDSVARGITPRQAAMELPSRECWMPWWRGDSGPISTTSSGRSPSRWYQPDTRTTVERAMSDPRSEEPLEHVVPLATPVVPLPAAAEVVVVGGGIMGASIAFHLAEAGVTDVVVLERGTLGSGSSAKPLGGVRATFSDANNVELGLRSLHAYETFADRFGIDIGLRQVGYLFLCRSEAELAAVEASVRLQNRLGYNSRMVTPAEAGEINPMLDPGPLLGASFSPRDGYAEPARVVEGYARAATRLGVRCCEHTEVLELATDATGAHQVRTQRGCSPPAR